MASIEILDAELEPMSLVPVDTAKKGLISGPPPESKPEIGGPVIIALTADRDDLKDDPDLIAYMKQEAGKFRFLIVTLACTLTPADGETFEEVWVKINLQRQDGADEPPIAWSMKPEKLSSDSEITKTAKLSSTLKLLDAEADLEVKNTYQRVYLEPRHELQSNPTWYLKTIEGVEIAGAYRFRMVVRAPLAACTGAINVSTNIGRNKWGVIPYSVEPPGQPPKTFALA